MQTPRTSLLPLLTLALTLLVGCPSPPASKPTTRPGTGAQQQADPSDPYAAKRGPRVQTVRIEPKLRIRVGQSLPRTTVSGSGLVEVGPGTADLGRARIHRFKSPLRISHDKQGFVITEPNGTSVRWRLAGIMLSNPGGTVSIDGKPYPGEVELVAGKDKAGRSTGRFDPINHVAMESYLPGVLSKELYPGWHAQAYRAQAIAARSYAIWEKQLPRRRASHFDLEASEASQAYIGANASQKAKDAVAATRGQVLVYKDRVLPAFYSSCSGGTGQDAIAAWPNKVDDLPPLRGKQHGTWGKQSTKFRWGPVTLATTDLAKGFAQWGRANKHRVAELQGLSKIQASATNRVGRPTRFTVTDARGRRFEMAAESVRNATNLALPGNAHRVNAKAFSSHAAYTIRGDIVTISGRGFGHGVGLCQFGAQHMASEGYRHGSILQFYYPSAAIKQVY